MKTRLVASAFVVAMWAMSLVVSGAEQLGTSRVWVHATVVDKEGRVVTGLQQQDFTVKADDVIRPITVFSRDELPVAMSLMLDVSGSMKAQVGNVRRAAEVLISQFIDGDRVNVGMFAGKIETAWGFTANRKKILEAIDVATIGSGSPCITGTGTPTGLQNGGTWLWDAVECGIKAVMRDGEAFRRVLVLVTDGVVHGGFATAGSATTLAVREGVLVYAVGISGEEGRADGLLAGLAKETGGGFLPLNVTDPKQQRDYTPAFQRIAEELHAQYVIAFDAPAGSSGKLTVTVSNPELKVRARKGYTVK